MHSDAVRACQEVLEANSRSFALAARLLPARARGEAAVLYSYCRRVDDAIDEVPASQRPDALVGLRREVDDLFAGRPGNELVLHAMAELIETRAIPRLYLDELLAGMQMDVEIDTGAMHYESEDDLLRYAHRVAGVVGLMCCHVLGVRDDDALLPAARLGWAMQITNICRDVAEDWERGRRYLPAQWFRDAGVEPPLPTGQPPGQLPLDTSRVVKRALAVAEQHYVAAQDGYPLLSTQAAWSIEVAARVYREIGEVLAERSWNVFAGRAVVSDARKFRLAARTIGAITRRFGARLRRRVDSGAANRTPQRVLRYAKGELLFD